MRVREAKNFNPEYPEMFNWNAVDSIRLTNIANDIVNHIEHDLRNIPEKRIVTGGLRLALRIIAEHAEF